MVANGFSCREQIAQQTDREALHLAEVLQLALHDGAVGEAEAYPEKHIVRERTAAIRHSMRKASLGLVGVAAGAALLAHLARRR